MLPWCKIYYGFWVANAGILYAGVQFNEDSFNWWVGTTPATEDKADERAIEEGNTGTLEEAKKEAEYAMNRLVKKMTKALGWTL